MVREEGASPRQRLNFQKHLGAWWCSMPVGNLPLNVPTGTNSRCLDTFGQPYGSGVWLSLAGGCNNWLVPAVCMILWCHSPHPWSQLSTTQPGNEDNTNDKMVVIMMRKTWDHQRLSISSGKTIALHIYIKLRWTPKIKIRCSHKWRKKRMDMHTVTASVRGMMPCTSQAGLVRH